MLALSMTYLVTNFIWDFLQYQNFLKNCIIFRLLGKTLNEVKI